MVVRRMLVGGAAAITLGVGLAYPARAADTPQAPGVPAALSPAQPDQEPGVSSLVIHKAHQDPADHAVEYTLWVRNEGTAPTHGKYTLVESLPDGATATSVDGGPRWSCATDAARKIATCTSSDGLAPGTTSDPITVRAGLTDADPCQLVNVAAVSGGRDATEAAGDRGEVNLAKDVLTLPCRRQAQAPAITVNVHVTGNNNGGRGGDSSGATANGNGHIHNIAGGIAKAGAKAHAKAGAKAHAKAGAKAHAKAGAKAHAKAVHRSQRHGGTRGCLRRHR